MELKDFISQTLVEIQAGVHDAIQKTIANKTAGAINPSWAPDNLPLPGELRQLVKFDIAVTVSDKLAGEAGGGIKVIGLKLGGDVTDSTETNKVSRIQFSIPIIPPVSKVGANTGK